MIAVLAGVVGRSAWVWWNRSPAELIAHHISAESPAVHGEVPQFSLADQNGRRVTLNTFKGHVWIADFIFTSCGGQCPMMTAQMTRLQAKLPKDIRLASFSVDPERDTPAVLAQYAKAHGAEEGRWLFLTGPQQELYRLSQGGFRLAVEPSGGSPAEPIIHSVRLVLIDRQARIRGYYDGSEDQSVQRLLRDTKVVWRETTK
ncbi:MAG: SCO family protein [Elusimicrobia bacterium]|nr:SCO family protein [Elusimicrobiota bacterium]